MSYFIESATIALQAIWASKLRSFMTVLGNIVAVTSIMAVVSLVQGMNADPLGSVHRAPSGRIGVGPACGRIGVGRFGPQGRAPQVQILSPRPAVVRP